MLASLPALLLSVLIAALGLGACASSKPPSPYRVWGYAHPVPPGTTFDLRRGVTLDEASLAARLAGVRMVFLGEHHTDSRAHAFQLEVLRLLADGGRNITVALEMFPPSANAALEDWRLGKLEETEFLQQSGWYRHWGFPFAHYRALFDFIRERRIALRGVNVEKSWREAARKGDAGELTGPEREELGSLDDGGPAHRTYVLDVLHAAGHAARAGQEDPVFQGFYRVQRMWDRVMGQRVAELAQAQGNDGTNNGVVVLLVGSGHLAHGLGANMHAMRAAPLPTLTVWDAVVDPRDLDTHGDYPVATGMADLARVYLRDKDQPEYPALRGVRLEAAEDGIKVVLTRYFGEVPHKGLQKDDTLLELNGQPLAGISPAALRLRYEALPWGSTVRWKLRRGTGEAATDEVVTYTLKAP